MIILKEEKSGEKEEEEREREREGEREPKRKRKLSEIQFVFSAREKHGIIRALSETDPHYQEVEISPALIRANFYNH